MTDLISPALVAIDADLGADREAVIRTLAGLVVESGRASDLDGLVADALAREAKADTGLPGGLAIPHCRSTAVTDWDDWDAAVGAGAPLLALVTHTDTVEGRPALEIGDRLRPLHLIDQGSINPGGERPGPLVLLMGCDTAHIAGSYTNVVDRLHALGATVLTASNRPLALARADRVLDLG